MNKYWKITLSILIVALISVSLWTALPCRNFYSSYRRVQIGDKIEEVNALLGEPIGRVSCSKYLVYYYKSPCFASSRLMNKNPIDFDFYDESNQLPECYGVVEVFVDGRDVIQAFQMFGEFPLVKSDSFEIKDVEIYRPKKNKQKSQK